MAIDTCDHNDYIVVYDTQKIVGCPVCELIRENEDLTAQVEDLESKVE